MRTKIKLIGFPDLEQHSRISQATSIALIALVLELPRFIASNSKLSEPQEGESGLGSRVRQTIFKFPAVAKRKRHA
jgi:hypothetical protein